MKFCLQKVLIWSLLYLHTTREAFGTAKLLVWGWLEMMSWETSRMGLHVTIASSFTFHKVNPKFATIWPRKPLTWPYWPYWKATVQNYIACETPSGNFEVRNDIACMVTTCITLFKTIDKLQTERLCHSSAIAFSWTDGDIILVSKKLIAFITPSWSSFTQSVVSGRHISHGKSWHVPQRLA